MKITDIPEFLRDGHQRSLIAWVVETYAAEISEDDPAGAFLKDRAERAARQIREFVVT